MTRSSADGVVLRGPRPGDAEPLAELLGDLGYPSTADQVRRRLDRLEADPRRHTVVAAVEGRVAGMAGGFLDLAYESDRVHCRLTALVVDPAHRGAGVGRRLVEAVEVWGSAAGADCVTLSSGLHRAGAHRFYERVGYRVTGYRFRKDLPDERHTARGAEWQPDSYGGSSGGTTLGPTTPTSRPERSRE